MVILWLRHWVLHRHIELQLYNTAFVVCVQVFAQYEANYPETMKTVLVLKGKVGSIWEMVEM